MIKTLFYLLLLLHIALLLYGCKKDKADNTPDPIAAYDFDNNLATNSMSSFFHGEVIGNITSTADSFDTPKTAFLFTKGYIRVLDSDQLDFPGNQFTITAWIKPSIATSTYIVHKANSNGGSGPYSLDIYPGYVRAYVRTTIDEYFEIKGTTKIIQDAWQHVAATFTGDHLTVYYNGKAEGSIPVDRPLMVSTGILAIGTYEYDFPVGSFRGKLDNIRIYDTALNADHIMHLYRHYKQ